MSKKRGLSPVLMVYIECARNDHGWYRCEAFTVKGNMLKASCEALKRKAAVSGCISACIRAGYSVAPHTEGT